MPLVLPLIEVQSVSKTFPRHAGMRTTDGIVVDNVSIKIEERLTRARFSAS